MQELLLGRQRKIISDARPFLIDGSLTEVSCYGITVYEVDRGLGGLLRKQIAIETRAFLPEPKAVFSWPLADGQPGEQRRTGFYQPALYELRDWLLDPSQILIDLGVVRQRENEQMNVFRHIHEGD